MAPASDQRRVTMKLVYRHALTVDWAGIGLPTGSTTGGVWDDDDAGQHWSALPARLAQIHAAWMG
jgi:hypothetical protein